MEVMDGISVISAKMLEIVDSVSPDRTLVGDTIPVSTGTVLVLVSSRSTRELLVSGRFDTIVSAETSSEAALVGTSVTEGSVGASVTICVIGGCVSELDMMADGRPVVSARALVSEISDAIVELSTTTELMVGMSSVVELVPRSPSPVSRGSGVTVGDTSRSEMVLDGRLPVTGISSVTEPGLKSVADGIAWTLVMTLEITSDGAAVSDERPKLDVMIDNSVVCSRALEITDSGSMVELSITDKIEDEASGKTEPLSNELVPGTSGAVVTEERISELVLYGKSIVESNAEVGLATASMLVVREVGISDMTSELTVEDGSSVACSKTAVGLGSRPIAEPSTMEGLIEEVSWMMELTSRMLVSAACDNDVDGSRPTRLVLDGKSVTEGNVKEVSRVASAYVWDEVKASD